MYSGRINSAIEAASLFRLCYSEISTFRAIAKNHVFFCTYANLRLKLNRKLYLFLPAFLRVCILKELGPIWHLIPIFGVGTSFMKATATWPSHPKGKLDLSTIFFRIKPVSSRYYVPAFFLNPNGNGCINRYKYWERISFKWDCSQTIISQVSRLPRHRRWYDSTSHGFLRTQYRFNISEYPRQYSLNILAYQT
jgi:hypothetical protein